MFAAREYAPETSVRCTYIVIPQAARTNAILVSRPFWLWGAEMGANEHGVTIGNEGLRARTPSPAAEALTGMDLLRLGLERSATAREAVSVITALLEKYGQGGNCGHLVPSYYHNSFMIADSREGFVLETVGREWLLEPVRDARAISNAYSISRDVSAVSRGLEDLLARDFDYEGGTQPDYADIIGDPQTTHIGSAVRAGDAQHLCCASGPANYPSPTSCACSVTTIPTTAPPTIGTRVVRRNTAFAFTLARRSPVARQREAWRRKFGAKIPFTG